MWQIDGSTASIRVGSVAARVNLRRPHDGLDAIRVDGQAIPGARVLEVRIGHISSDQDKELVDCYMRGTDLVAVYAQGAGQNVRAQIYWRAVQFDAWHAAGVEILASVQTNSLDGKPHVVVGSTLPSSEVWRLSDEANSRYERLELSDSGPSVLDSGAGLLLFRLSNFACGYAEMIHPADFTMAEIWKESSLGHQVRSGFRLFDEPLEKGVIRRSRLRGILLPGEEDERAAVECYRSFAESALPLTT